MIKTELRNFLVYTKRIDQILFDDLCLGSKFRVAKRLFPVLYSSDIIEFLPYIEAIIWVL